MSAFLVENEETYIINPKAEELLIGLVEIYFYENLVAISVRGANFIRNLSVFRVL